VFDREVYEVNINESAPVGTPVVRLKVSDADSGLNAKVRLNIVGGNKNGQFRMNPTSGVLYVARPLDAESKGSYTLTVTALDQANTGLRKQSSAKVRILVSML
jgi:protocadherin Fat 1/2/3